MAKPQVQTKATKQTKSAPAPQTKKAASKPSSDGFVDDDYEEPSGPSNYMSLEKGDNKFRCLSKPVMGWQEWVEKKPLRYREDEKPEESADPENPLKFFWAIKVFDYADNQVKLLLITQASVRKAILSLSKDSDWGTPLGYDLKVTRTGDNLQTKYTVTPSPKKPLSKEMVNADRAKPCNIEAIFEGEDAFKAE